MDPPFFGQHPAQQLSDGNILMYDNRNMFTVGTGRLSRVLGLQLEPKNMTATKVWSFTHPMKLISPCCGGVQMVDNGEGNPPTVLITWGKVGPFFTEVTYEEEARIVREFEGFVAHRGQLLHLREGSSAERPRLLLCSDANTDTGRGLAGLSTSRSMRLQGDGKRLRPSKTLKGGPQKVQNTQSVVRRPMVLSSDDEPAGAGALSPPAGSVPWRCYQPDISLRQHLARPKPGRESPVVDVATVNDCGRACADSDTCETFFFFEDTGECELNKSDYVAALWKMKMLHSLQGVIQTGRKEAFPHSLAQGAYMDFAQLIVD
ncbi:unnamed protein product [Vitrella brassicaformis CCMP3155]|uniref:Apple domain-containing protein n=1 Tax=Vitrella brassicaformis (strain CCMP3155) TaxID=1169540 RepID=A0A0G4H147_VITBC|nr:unnamed protein product [Vitrella brassicaformis CCMP3155]|eukprot:CEM37258.1 unnamed protein product [Vitrella brassicaformis CCMP3155]